MKNNINRLWVRISLVIVIIVIFGMLLPLIVGIAMREFRVVDPNLPPEISEEIEEETLQELREDRGRKFFPGWFVLNNLAPILLGASIVSIIAGVLLSRNLSAPLANLAEAARSIGQRDLSRRVPVRGSQEIQEVTQAFNQMAADLEQAETLRQNLLADVAHELRTPITVIQGNLQAILDDVYELDKKEIAHLYDQTRQLTHLVDDLRELAQAEAQQLPLEIVPVDVALLIEELVVIYEPILESSQIDLQTQISEGNLEIQGDRGRIFQVLQNLINNANKYTPENGRITISAHEIGDFLQLEVADNGAGISPEHLAFVFDRFYRTDPARARETGGTGLGLAITRAIIENHGGKIFVESEGEGKGSTFSILLPRS